MLLLLLFKDMKILTQVMYIKRLEISSLIHNLSNKSKNVKKKINSQYGFSQITMNNIIQ